MVDDGEGWSALHGSGRGPGGGGDCLLRGLCRSEVVSTLRWAILWTSWTRLPQALDFEILPRSDLFLMWMGVPARCYPARVRPNFPSYTQPSTDGSQSQCQSQWQVPAGAHKVQLQLQGTPPHVRRQVVGSWSLAGKHSSGRSFVAGRSRELDVTSRLKAVEEATAQIGLQEQKQKKRRQQPATSLVGRRKVGRGNCRK